MLLATFSFWILKLQFFLTCRRNHSIIHTNYYEDHYQIDFIYSSDKWRNCVDLMSCTINIMVVHSLENLAKPKMFLTFLHHFNAKVHNSWLNCLSLNTFTATFKGAHQRGYWIPISPWNNRPYPEIPWKCFDFPPCTSVEYFVIFRGKPYRGKTGS